LKKVSISFKINDTLSIKSTSNEDKKDILNIFERFLKSENIFDGIYSPLKTHLIY